MSFIEVALLSKLPPGKSKLVRIDGKPIALFNVEGQIFATQELCPHRAGPLSEGVLENNVVSCPWHGARFNVSDGSILGGPAQRSLTCYPVQIDGDRILVSLDLLHEK